MYVCKYVKNRITYFHSTYISPTLNITHKNLTSNFLGEEFSYFPILPFTYHLKCSADHKKGVLSVGNFTSNLNKHVLSVYMYVSK